ncbi:MAG: hypothetical protein ACLGHN_13830 [Bacteriovoracia bacterium]
MNIHALKQLKDSRPFQLVCLLILVSIIAWDLGELNPETGMDFWFELHEMFYLGAMFVGLLSLFKISHFWASIGGLFLGFLSGYTELFDEILHPLLAKSVYPASFAGNPQYTKLIAYSFVFGALGLSLFFTKKRMQKIFCLILMSVNIFLVLNNHLSYPGGIFKRLTQIRVGEISLLQTLDLGKVNDYCEFHKIICRVKSGDKIEALSTQLEVPEDYRSYYDDLKQGFTNTFPRVITDTNKTPSIYGVFPRKDGMHIEAFDPFKMQEYWQMNAFFFYRNSSLVSSGWFFFFMLLGFVHRRVSARER